jgi:hypothetical protein
MSNRPVESIRYRKGNQGYYFKFHNDRAGRRRLKEKLSEMAHGKDHLCFTWSDVANINVEITKLRYKLFGDQK